MTSLKILYSTQDESVNFVSHAPSGFFESRYVYRPGADYFIVYLSSQSGCNKGCQFCHLTTTKQFRHVDASHDKFMLQAEQVLEYAASKDMPNHVSTVHFNFMARGEFLDSVTDLDADYLLADLGKQASEYGLNSKFNISTIMPKTFKGTILDVFKYMQPTFYYSLYSVNQAFRDYWLPAAMDVDKALGLLKEYQEFTGKPIKIHFAFIEGQNDSEKDVKDLAMRIKMFNLITDINIMRYNPPDDKSREPPYEVIRMRADQLAMHLGRFVQIVPSVGYDVKASCGMFVEPGFGG